MNTIHEGREMPITIEECAVNTTIPTLGEPKINNPLPYCNFVEPDATTLIEVSGEDYYSLKDCKSYAEFETVGPREKIYFDPSKTKCAIVTCGGLCPGINDVIRAIVLEAHYNYHVVSFLGIRYGLRGFIPRYGIKPVNLTPEYVSNIHQFGGTILASSRGPQDPVEIVDSLERMNVNILFVIGGDGTMRAAKCIQDEVKKRGIKLGVIGIPKTIDNDISFITRSFGFDTAVEKATEAISCAHTEATGAHNGIGVVKLMGRESGFIAAQATLAMKDVNLLLVPEDKFELHGEHGLLEPLARRLRERSHAVIVIAEGAGQHLVNPTGEKDASGNVKLADFSTYFIQEVKQYLNERDIPHTLKFIDPSYLIRSIPANSNDRVYCGFLGQNAVHAAMAGKTGMVVGRLHSRYVHLPLDLVTMQRKKLDIKSDYWRSVLESTGMEHCALTDIKKCCF